MQELRKAAVLVSCLDEADAQGLLARLESTSARQVRSAIIALGPVSPAERDGVMREFLRQRASGASRTGGVELDESLARRLAAAAESDDSDPRAGTFHDAGGQAPFAFLLETEADVVAPFLARENPQTVAVVLSFLRRQQAAEILQRLESSLQRQVLKRLANLEDLDPACVDAVAAELRVWIDRQRELPRPPTGQEKLVRDVLATARRSDRAQFLAGLHGPAIRRDPLAFNDLMQLTDHDLRRVLQAAPQEVLNLALAGADERWIDRITQSLSRRDANRLKQSIQLQGPTRLDDIETAQQRIAEIAEKVVATSS